MKRLFLIIFILFLIASVSASTQINYTASKGGVFNGGFETGTGMAGTGTGITNNWVGSENYGWRFAVDSDNTIGYYDANVSRSGSKSFNITNLNSTGAGRLNNLGAGTLTTTICSKYGIPVKPSTNYRLMGYAITNNASLDSAYLRISMMDVSAITGSTLYTSKLSGNNPTWTPVYLDFTSDNDAQYIMLTVNNNVAGNISTVLWDDITLEEVVTDTQANAYTVKPVVQGVTSVDNIDQSLDSGFAQTNQYALGTTISETAANWQVFTPTKSKITNISFKVASTGTSAGWNISVHDSSNNTLSSNQFAPVLGIQSVPVPALWSSGNYHFHIISTTTTGAPSINATTTNDMDTASYIEYYAKNTEDVSIIVNGVNLNLTSNGTAVGDATGILSGATIDLDKGFYNWTSNVITTAGAYSFANNVYSAGLSTRGGYESYNAYIINRWGGAVTYHLATNKPFVIKVNTMLPAKNVSFATNYWGTEQPEIYNWSLDGITWTEFTRGTTGGAQWTPLIGNFSPNAATFYIQGYGAGASTNVEFTYMSINATLNTTGLPTQSVIAGTNYYNISSNGRADSASLDPSMQVNVWLMSQVALPIVQWITDKTTVVFPGKIYFNDTSLNTPTQWNWSFGDGTWYNTTNPDLGLNKSYQYTKRGVWIANLTVGNAAGTNTSASAAKSIRVIGYQGAELPETLTIWDQLNLFFRQLVDLIYCIFSGTVCGSNQAQVLEA